MRVRPIHSAILAAGALLASPAIAEDYPLPVLGAVAYSEASYETEWDGSYEGAYDGGGQVIYMDELEDGEEWHSGDYDDRPYYDDRPDYDEVRRDSRPLPPPRTGEPAWGGDHALAYGEGERQAWLAECRSRMSQGGANGGDACGDYLARYESGVGGYAYDYSYGGQASSRGCGCGCNGGCGGGCGGGGCGCTVSYRFAPMPAMPVAQRRQSSARRIITTEEWEEEVPGKAVRVIPPPPVVRTKIVPATPAPAPRPVKTIKPRYSK